MSKYKLILKGINTEEVEKKYGIAFIGNIYDKGHKPPKNTTKLTDITKKEPDVTTFLDELKKPYKVNISMIDALTNKELPRDKCCFWDRNPFNTNPIGCPIRFIPKYHVHSHVSEITNINVISKESSRVEGYYETDGIFCSFNCIFAFIEDNKKNPLYKDSFFLTKKMHNDIFENELDTVIYPAPHWRLLKDYGGQLTIEKFRESFNRFIYEDLKCPIRKVPCNYSIGFAFNENIKL